MSIQITFTVETPEEASNLLKKFSANTGASAPAKAEATSSATPSKESSETTSEENTLLISAAVQKYAEENNVDVTAIKGTGKDGRILKKDVTAALPKSADSASTEPEAAPQESSPTDDDLEIDEGDDLDLFDDDDEEEPTATKEDVRNAMVALQSAIRDKYIADGLEETDAKRKAIDKTRGFLKQISGSDTLGGIDEGDYQAIVDKATAQTKKLAK